MKNSKYSYNLLEAFEDLNREAPLKESRSIADIEAEIAKLQKELEAAKGIEKDSSDQKALSLATSKSNIDIEELIDHMREYGRLPRLSYKWEMNDVYDEEDVSMISFSHRNVPISIWFWVSTTLCDDWHQNRITVDYEITIDEPDTTDNYSRFSHKTEVLSAADPEGCIKHIYKIVKDADELVEAWKAGTKEFNKKLQDLGYDKEAN